MSGEKSDINYNCCFELLTLLRFNQELDSDVIQTSKVSAADFFEVKFPPIILLIAVLANLICRVRQQ